MRRLSVHIGAHKTGSSAIQWSLAKSAARLAELGIDYPYSQPPTDREIPVGNGLKAQQILADLAQSPSSNTHTLISSELLFHRFADPQFAASFWEGVRDAQIDEVQFLCLVRAPIPHASSWYGQQVKRHGTTMSVDEHFAAYSYPILATEVFNAIEPQGTLTVRSYDATKKHLLPLVAEWIDAPVDALTPPPAPRTNRSLDLAEIEVQRALNRVLGRQAEVVAGALCEELPDLRGVNPVPSAEVQEAMTRRLASALDTIDAYLPPGESLSRAAQEPTGPAGGLSAEQVAVIAAAISSLPAKPQPHRSLATRAWRRARRVAPTLTAKMPPTLPWRSSR